MKFIFHKFVFLLIATVLFTAVVNSQNFNSPRELEIPDRQYAVGVDDLNKDGIPDLILGGDPPTGELSKIRVFIGKGNGNFHLPPQQYVVGFNEVFGIATGVDKIAFADMDNDDNLDVIVTHNGNRTQFNANPILVTILFGDGLGNLETTPSIRFKTNGSAFLARSLVIDDINLDGFPDVLIGGWGSKTVGKINFVLNNGNRSFSPFGAFLVSGDVGGLKKGNFNNDTFTDYIASTVNGITIIYGTGVFPFPKRTHLNTVARMDRIVVGDFNKDNKDDFITSEFLNNQIRVYLQNDKGFSNPPLLIKLDIIASDIENGDMNQDGFDDVVITSQFGGIQILYGDGKGGFTLSEVITADLSPGLALSDINMDGKLDFITATYSRNEIQAQIFLNSPNPNRYYSDFNGDTKADLTLFRPSSATWWTLFSDDFSYQTTKFGLPTDTPVAGNFDGDNKTDLAVYRDGTWFVLNSSDGSVSIESWGLSDDIPVPADYDNDGKMNLAVYRPSEGIWYIKNEESTAGIKWGIATDIPVPNDYDGDGKTDIAVWRESEGNWYILQSSNYQALILKFGQENDRPVPSDYDGDGKADISIYRNGNWYIYQSKFNSIRYESFGLETDIPTPKDFDGDGKSDISVFRQNEGNWYILNSQNRNLQTIKWGISTDIP